MKRKKQQVPEENFISAKSRNEVLADIQRLEEAGETDELRGYLIQLSKWGDKPQQYENLLRSYLYSSVADLREAAVFALLYGLGLQKEEYRTCALAQLTLANENDLEARRWAAFSLAHAYRGQMDRTLLHAFFAVLDNESEELSLKELISRDILTLWGLSGREQAFRLRGNTSLSALLNEFKTELDAAREASR